MRYKHYIIFLAILFTYSVCIAESVSTNINNSSKVTLYSLPSFFRFSLDNMSMPNNDANMTLLGLNYFGDITPQIYAGVGAYGAITGTQGGLFTLGIEGGFKPHLFKNWWGDAGLFVGGGGGRSSLVGGGLMIRPHVGLAYAWSFAKLEIHYSYISFPSGKIHSQQIGVDLDIPTNFYYVSPRNKPGSFISPKNIYLLNQYFLNTQRNDFGVLLAAYFQKNGTLNTSNELQDGTIYLVGAEIDHYMTENLFWWIKASGAYSGIPNGYMDVIGGVGYHYQLGKSRFSLIPQFGMGAGGGGMVNSGGGFLIHPLLGIETELNKQLALRASSGYLWSPGGNLSATPLIVELLYHLNFATGSKTAKQDSNNYRIIGWRIQAFNQTYLHPQRGSRDVTSSINLIGVQIDQIFTPIFFFSYQAASAYQGDHSGGYASGMIGPGIQSPSLLGNHLQFFGELLFGAGGGGGLALSGGALIEPVIGMHLKLNESIGLQLSYSQLKALRDNLNTPVINAGITISFATPAQV